MTLRFAACPEPTVGVELELQLLDAATLDLADGILPLMEFFPKTTRVKPEFIQSCVEITSTPCTTVEAVQHSLLTTLCGLRGRAVQLGMSLCGAGTHVFGRELALITPQPRYIEAQADYGVLAPQHITFATHVHVGMPSGNTAVFVMRHLTPCLPVLLAASANSPFWRGYDTGFASYRHCILAAGRTYGIPPYFEDWDDFVHFFDTAVRGAAYGHIRDIHWDIRPHPDFGTLELRVMDAASTLADATALASFVRALMVYLTEHVDNVIDPRMPARLDHWIERTNRYRACHLGLDADLIIDRDGAQRPLRALLDDLLDVIEPTARRLGDGAALEWFTRLMQADGGYGRQRRLQEEGESMNAIVAALERDLLSEMAPPDLPVRDEPQC